MTSAHSRTSAVRHHRALDSGQQFAYAGVVAADHVDAVKRNLVHELGEGFVDGLAVGVEIQVVHVHVGDHVHDRHQTQERAVGFVRLGDQVRAAAQTGIGPVGVESAADDHRRVQARFIENGRRQRSGRGFAVGAGNGDARAQAHEFRQHFGPGNDRNAAFPGRHHFRVVFAHGRGFHQHVGLSEVFRIVPARGDHRAQLAQPGHRGGFGHVGAVHRIAHVQQNLGNAAHAGPADADHVDGVYPVVHAVLLGK